MINNAPKGREVKTPNDSVVEMDRRIARLEKELREAKEAKKLVCDHEFVSSQIAGDPARCRHCGEYADFE